MRTLIIIAFCFISTAAMAQEYPIYSPVRIYGSLALDPVAVLPTGTPLKMVNSAGKLWIYDGTWKQLWPPKFNSDTLDNIYIQDDGIIKFVNGGFIHKHSPGSYAIGISPNGTQTESQILLISSNSEPLGLTVSNIQTIRFTPLLYPGVQDDMHGFTNDTITDADTSFAPSIAATKKIAASRGGISPGTVELNQAIYGTANDKIGGSNNIHISEDSLKLLNQITGEYESVQITPGGALETYKPYVPFQIILTDTLAVTPDSTDYILTIGSVLHGYNLIAAELIKVKSAGNRVPTVTVWRKRGATEVNMTSTGATLATPAVINPSYDDVAREDIIRFKTVLGTGEIAPYGLHLHIIFQKQ